MEIKDLKKNKNRSVRINSEILILLESIGYTLQSFLDSKLEEEFTVKVEIGSSTKKQE